MVAVVGPTATGKSAVAMELARRAPGGAIVSVDSMQVYRGMDIGTAKPGPAERAEIPHHLIDVADPADGYSVAEYQRAARTCLDDQAAAGRPALLVGGTGLYLRAVVDRLDIPPRWPEERAELEAEADRLGTPALHSRLAVLDPLAASRMLPTNRRRVLRALEVCLGSGRPFSSFGPGLETHPDVPVRLVGLEVERAELDRRIAARLEGQLEAGFLTEVAGLLARPAGLGPTARQALGYRELIGHLDGSCSLDEALELTRRRTRTFARRQEAWFRRDPRIEWLAAGGPPAETATALAGRLGDWWS